MRLLILFAFTLTAGAAEIVHDSGSPNGKWQVAAELVSEGARYRVASRTMNLLTGSYPSDYWRLEDCVSSRVVWRPDGAYFIIEETASGIHQEFVVVRKTRSRFATMSFDREVIMRSTKLPWHHGAVQFDGWLPKDRMAVTVYGDLDFPKVDFECSFVLDLKHRLRVRSFRIVKPK